MPSSADSDELWYEAMALLLDWQAAPGDAARHEAIRRFYQTGPEHAAAWRRAKEVFRVSGEAVSQRRRKQRISRRAVLAIAGGAATACIAGVNLVRRPRGQIETATAEIRRLPLQDGSWLTLGPSSAIDIDYSDRYRRVALNAGSAFFEIGFEDRPFLAHAGNLTASAKKAGLELKRTGDWSFAAVTEGEVVAEVPSFADARSRLISGDWISLGPETRGVRQGRRDVAHVAAWRDRILVADSDSISVIVAEIARWYGTPVLIPQSSLANAPISGVFDLTNPEAALAAVVAPFGGRLRHVSPWLAVLTTV